MSQQSDMSEVERAEYITAGSVSGAIAVIALGAAFSMMLRSSIPQIIAVSLVAVAVPIVIAVIANDIVTMSWMISAAVAIFIASLSLPVSVITRSAVPLVVGVTVAFFIGVMMVLFMLF